MDKKALLEAGKEIVRNTILAVIPVLLSGIDTEKGVFSVKGSVILAVALYTILTGIDRYLHISGSATAKKIDKGESFGLVRL